MQCTRRAFHRADNHKIGSSHIHHVLMSSGLTVRQTLHLVYLLTISSISFGVSINIFGLTHLESIIVFVAFMFLYLGRVGSLSRKTQESHITQVLDIRKEPSFDDNIIDISKQRNTLN